MKQNEINNKSYSCLLFLKAIYEVKASPTFAELKNTAIKTGADKRLPALILRKNLISDVGMSKFRWNDSHGKPTLTMAEELLNELDSGFSEDASKPSIPNIPEEKSGAPIVTPKNDPPAEQPKQITKKGRRKNILSYEDAKAILKPLGLKSSHDYYQLIKAKQLPEGCPTSIYDRYKKDGTWISWDDYLSVDPATKKQRKKPNRVVDFPSPIPEAPGPIIIQPIKTIDRTVRFEKKIDLDMSVVDAAGRELDLINKLIDQVNDQLRDYHDRRDKLLRAIEILK